MSFRVVAYCFQTSLPWVFSDFTLLKDLWFNVFFSFKRLALSMSESSLQQNAWSVVDPHFDIAHVLSGRDLHRFIVFWKVVFDVSRVIFC